MENNNSEEVNLLIRTKQILEQISEKKQSIECNKIYKTICDYLIVNCQHHMITDYIDISHDRSIQIIYCKWCYENTSKKCSTSALKKERSGNDGTPLP